MKTFITLLVFAAAASSTAALGDAAGRHGGSAAARPADARETGFGRPADPKKAGRTIRIGMSDEMRFTPAVLSVKQGEIVRFVVKNSGRVLHEMVLGTAEELRDHAELMRKNPGMEHDEAHMVHVRPGKSGAFAWQFTQAGEFQYGCLIPGHFEAGMVGTITVVAK